MLTGIADSIKSSEANIISPTLVRLWLFQAPRFWRKYRCRKPLRLFCSPQIQVRKRCIYRAALEKEKQRIETDNANLKKLDESIKSGANLFDGNAPYR